MIEKMIENWRKIEEKAKARIEVARNKTEERSKSPDCLQDNFDQKSKNEAINSKNSFEQESDDETKNAVACIASC